jgi:hypothetical protein
VLKRLLVHARAFNLGLWTRRLFGIGTPRALRPAWKGIDRTDSIDPESEHGRLRW